MNFLYFFYTSGVRGTYNTPLSFHLTSTEQLLYAQYCYPALPLDNINIEGGNMFHTSEVNSQQYYCETSRSCLQLPHTTIVPYRSSEVLPLVGCKVCQSFWQYSIKTLSENNVCLLNMILCNSVIAKSGMCGEGGWVILIVCVEIVNILFFFLFWFYNILFWISLFCGPGVWSGEAFHGFWSN